MSHLNEQFQDKMEYNLYFTLRGCEQDGYYKIPKTTLNAIINWSGSCTDPNESEDFYKNPRAMFVALDLIHEILSKGLNHGLHASKWYGDKCLSWELPKIQEV